MAPRDPTFAPAISDLRRTPLADLVVTPEPSPGQGYPLDEEGHFPATTMEGEWNIEINEVTVDLASTLEHAGDSVSVSVPGLQVGDYCFVLGQTVANTRAFLCFTTGLCVTEGQIPLQFFNTDDATVNPDAKTFYFLCIHRRITQ